VAVELAGAVGLGAVLVAGAGVAEGATAVSVGGWVVPVGGGAVLVAGAGVFVDVGGSGVAVGMQPARAIARITARPTMGLWRCVCMALPWADDSGIIGRNEKRLRWDSIK
jgi:hypothetical protein